MKRNKILSLIMCGVLAATTAITAVFVGTGCKKNEDAKAEAVTPVENMGYRSVFEDKNEGVRIQSFSAPVFYAAEQTVTKTVTAVVYPTDEPNKAVDWSVAWATDAPLKSENISNYITIAPTSDGALTANITCKKSFKGSVAYVKVVTRVGKFEAMSTVKYEGIPSSLEIDCSGLEKDTGANASHYIVPVGGASVNVNLSNVFGVVGDSYYSNITCSVSGVGKIVVNNLRQGTSGESWDGTDKEITLESIKSEIFTATIANKQLKITPKKTVESYYSRVGGGGSGAMYYDRFKEYVANSAGGTGITPYFKVTVKCGDLTKDINIVIVSSVESVMIANPVVF